MFNFKYLDLSKADAVTSAVKGCRRSFSASMGFMPHRAAYQQEDWNPIQSGKSCKKRSGNSQTLKEHEVTGMESTCFGTSHALINLATCWVRGSFYHLLPCSAWEIQLMVVVWDVGHGLCWHFFSEIHQTDFKNRVEGWKGLFGPQLIPNTMALVPAICSPLSCSNWGLIAKFAEMAKDVRHKFPYTMSQRETCSLLAIPLCTQYFCPEQCIIGLKYSKEWYCSHPSDVH
jgi:hypothetical protein